MARELLSLLGMKTNTERDWAGRKTTGNPITYIDRTGQDIGDYHAVVMAAIKADGVFTEDFADIFKLTRPAGVWILDFA